MRVIAGQFRSRRLAAIGSLKLRPTSDRLRETLFDVLTGGNPDALHGTVWLDLFAGTGAVGIEALSRGAAAVHFVENDGGAVALIRRNLQSLKIVSGYEIHQQSVATALQNLQRRGIACDYCFLDPPYSASSVYAEVLSLLGDSSLLQPTSLVIAEHDVRSDPGESFGALQRYRRLDQGDASLSFYRRARRRKE